MATDAQKAIQARIRAERLAKAAGGGKTSGKTGGKKNPTARDRAEADKRQKTNDRDKTWGERQGERNRKQWDEYGAPPGSLENPDVTTASTNTTRTGFEGEGSDTQDVLDAAMAKYGGIITGSGRRGSQARSSLSAGQSNPFEDALTSGAYQRLLSDSSAIGDINVQNELSNLGIDWKSFASGTDVRTVDKDTSGDVSSDTLENIYEDIDMVGFEEYLKNQANPFAVLRGEQGAMAAETVRAAENLQLQLGQQQTIGDLTNPSPPAPLPSLLSGTSEPNNQQQTTKRI
ncbi:MAG: hypothetical protein DRP32_06050 [Thermotogae bacterium]|nr:MAG: hypothetical protein DRP32_06050 [Thermotogota bacterium]